jgi:hypothetical protein
MRLRLSKSDSIVLPPSLKDKLNQSQDRLAADPFRRVFLGFCRARRKVDGEPSIRRSLVRPGLPANRTEQPIAARSVFEGEEE